MTNAMIGMPSHNIFISYAHKDNVDPDPKKCWLDRLLEQLQPLNVQSLVKCSEGGAYDIQLRTGLPLSDRTKGQAQPAAHLIKLSPPSP